ncbi:hypothetical protein QJQ45_019853, partial [Haematococcus lacustris]
GGKPSRITLNWQPRSRPIRVNPHFEWPLKEASNRAGKTLPSQTSNISRMAATMILAIAVALLAQGCRAAGPITRMPPPDFTPPWFCHSINCPPFTVENDNVAADVELRRYAAGLWVATNISDTSYDAAVGTGFKRLFDYISGEDPNPVKTLLAARPPAAPPTIPSLPMPNLLLGEAFSRDNEGSLKVDMTAPVRVRLTPGPGPFCKDDFTVAFYLPWTHQVTPL